MPSIVGRLKANHTSRSQHGPGRASKGAEGDLNAQPLLKHRGITGAVLRCQISSNQNLAFSKILPPVPRNMSHRSGAEIDAARRMMVPQNRTRQHAIRPHGHALFIKRHPVHTSTASSQKHTPFTLPHTFHIPQTRLTTSICQLRHDQMEQGPTEPHAGCSTFLLSSGGAGGAGITEWPLIRGRSLLRTTFPARR